MKKIRLALGALEVQSFATSALPRAHGTVRGAQQDDFASKVDCASGGMCAGSDLCGTSAPDPNCLIFTAGQDTCPVTCPDTCQNCNLTDTCLGVPGC